MHKVALIGFGCVGQGFYRICRSHSQLPFELTAICDRKPNAYQGDEVEFFTDFERLIEKSEIDIIVEAINSAPTALRIAQKTLESGKNLVTANKKMVCENLAFLLDLQQKTGKSIWFEAAVGGAIPIIETLDSHFAYFNINSIKGILNGTTNYILTAMFEQGMDYEKALLAAQVKGFAESDPTLDVEGYDAKNKLVLMLLLAYGLVTKPEDIFNYGINFLQAEDLKIFKSRGLTVKSLVHGVRTMQGQIRAYVLPTLLDKSQAFANIDFEENALEIHGLHTEKIFISGKGAGSLPTGSAVFSDVVRAVQGKSYRLDKFFAHQPQLERGYAPKILFLARSAESIENLQFNDLQKIDAGQNRHWYIGQVSLEQLIEWESVLKQKKISIIDLTYAGAFGYHMGLKSTAKSVLCF